MIWRVILPAIAGGLYSATSYQTDGRMAPQSRRNLKRDGGWLTVAGLFCCTRQQHLRPRSRQ